MLRDGLDIDELKSPGALHGHFDRPVVDGTRWRREMGVPVRRATADPLRESRRGVKLLPPLATFRRSGAHFDSVIEVSHFVASDEERPPSPWRCEGRAHWSSQAAKEGGGEIVANMSAVNHAAQGHRTSITLGTSSPAECPGQGDPA